MLERTDSPSTPHHYTSYLVSKLQSTKPFSTDSEHFKLQATPSNSFFLYASTSTKYPIIPISPNLHPHSTPNLPPFYQPPTFKTCFHYFSTTSFAKSIITKSPAVAGSFIISSSSTLTSFHTILFEHLHTFHYLPTSNPEKPP